MAALHGKATSLVHHQHPCAPFARPCPPQPRCPRTAYLVRAEGEGEQLRGISFKSNKNANLGYTEDDSAGQSNIFAVEPKQYVGNRDGSSPSLTLPIIAAVVATGAIGLGLFAVRGSGPDVSAVKAEASSKEYLTLSEYKQQFSSEVSLAPSLRADASLS